MAGCSSLTALPRACGAEGIVAGLEKAYIVSFNDLAAPSGSVNGDVYTVDSETGMVASIGVASGKMFVEVGLLKSTAGLTEKLTKDTKVGSAYLTQTFTLVLADLSADNKSFVENVLNQPVAVIVKSRTNKFYAAGLNGQLELTTLDGGTGAAEGDLMGYTLTFEGIDTKLIPAVDPTIINGLLSASTTTTSTTTTTEG